MPLLLVLRNVLLTNTLNASRILKLLDVSCASLLQELRGLTEACLTCTYLNRFPKAALLRVLPSLSFISSQQFSV